jgi:hypothetical protein
MQQMLSTAQPKRQCQALLLLLWEVPSGWVFWHAHEGAAWAVSRLCTSSKSWRGSMSSHAKMQEKLLL